MNIVDAMKLYEIATRYPFVVCLPNNEMYGVDSIEDGHALLIYERQAMLELMIYLRC